MKLNKLGLLFELEKFISLKPIPLTRTKKVLMLVPTLITLLACYASDFDWNYLFINVGLFLLCILPKIPAMHRVRLFGINSTPAVDEDEKED